MNLLCQQIYTNSPLRNFSYIIYSKEKSHVICVDPWDSQQIINYLEKHNLVLTHIINTHEHFDHIRGNEGLIKYNQAKVWAHPNAKSKLEKLDRCLENNEEIEITDQHHLKVLDTPGHTFAHISLLLRKKEKNIGIFSGDTFFNAGVGNCHNGGDPEVLYESISREYSFLEDDVFLYPGHDYMENNLDFTLEYEITNTQAKKLQIAKSFSAISTMGLEREINLFLRLDSIELRKELKKYFSSISEESSPKEIFLALRKLRNEW